MSGYMICTSPRSGSTLLCTLLRATRVAGWPESLFHGPSLEDWAKRLDLARNAPFDAIVAAALMKGRADGPVFGVRQQWPSFPLLSATLKRTRFETIERARLEGALGPLRYIFLVREDKIAQAVSFIRAKQTGIWHRNADGSIYEQKDASENAGFDADAIRAQAAEFEGFDAAWQTWFSAQGITPLALTYDDLAKDPNSALMAVLDWIGLDPCHARGISAPTQKLTDYVKDDWVQRVKAG